ncbi:hypothetical protein JXJ21_23895 [candidate division KSB1 bacterium]|nr:hypothetical protein [candidate division KSB1 bacterium]
MKFTKYIIAVLILIAIIVLYNTPAITTWRYFNNGVNAFNKQQFEAAAQAFRQAASHSDDPILVYNWVLSQSKFLQKSLAGDSDAVRQVQPKLMRCRQVVDSLLQVKQLPQNVYKNSLFLQGKLQLASGDTSAAVHSFSQALDSQRDFEPALVALAKLKQDQGSDPVNDAVRRLVLKMAGSEEPGIVEKFKPF